MLSVAAGFGLPVAGSSAHHTQPPGRAYGEPLVKPAADVRVSWPSLLTQAPAPLRQCSILPSSAVPVPCIATPRAE
jgi:hypothetical protein